MLNKATQQEPVSLKAQAWRVDFQERPSMADLGSVVIKEPRNVNAVLARVDVEEALASGRTESGGSLIIVWMAPGVNTPSSIEHDVEAWMRDGASSVRQTPVRATIRTVRVIWHDSRALIYTSAEQLQDAIDATIAEVTLNDDLSYGVQSYLTSRNVGLKPNTGSILNTQATTAPATTVDATTGIASVAGSVTNAFINRAFPGFNFLIGSETQPSLILDALHTVTSVKVLSNPSLVVINNQVATLQVGDVVPVSTGSATVLTTSKTVVNTIDYRNTGIILRVSPRINVNGNVRLDIEQEISNVSAATASSLTADGFGTKGQEFNFGGDRPNGVAGRIDQRAAERHAQRAAGARSTSGSRRRRLWASG